MNFRKWRYFRSHAFARGFGGISLYAPPRKFLKMVQYIFIYIYLYFRTFIKYNIMVIYRVD